MARIFLHEDQIGRCSLCKNYLSVGPIVIFENKPVCARCPQTIGPQAIFYEKLAEYMFFPCKNDVRGCDVMLAWGSVMKHENICKFNPLICPAPNCGEKIEKEHLILHFTLAHKKSVLEKNEFKVPRRPGLGSTKLFVWRNKPFLLKYHFMMVFCFVDVVGFDEGTNQKLEYNLVVEDDTKRRRLLLKNNYISEYSINHRFKTTSVKLIVDDLRKDLASDELICTFNIESRASSNHILNNELLAELECPVCIEHLRPPIFMCALGHAICSKCRKNIVVCPTCQITLNNNRNFTLEKIIEHITYPCKYRDEGCPIIGKLPVIQSHEASCSIGACYVSYFHPCDWKGPSSEQISHISQTHPEFFVNLKNSIQLDLAIFRIMNVYFESNSRIFHLKISHEKRKWIRVNVTPMISSDDVKEKCRFFIDFEDSNDSQRTLSLNKDCVSARVSDLGSKDSLMISYQMYRPLMEDEKVNLKINIICK